MGFSSSLGDPLLRELETTVVTCSISQPAPVPAAKKTKKAVIAPTLPSDPILEVILHDTVIFPEGGGQPTDTGLITTSDGKNWTVIQAKRHGGHAVHYVQVPSNEDLESALKVFTPGSTVTAKLGKADFDRRYDHVCIFGNPESFKDTYFCRRCLCTPLSTFFQLSWKLG